MSDRLNDASNHATRPCDSGLTGRGGVSGTMAPGPSRKSLVRPSHQHVLDAFTTHGPMTPDELAIKICRSVFYTRPRCSELRALGLLHATGETRPNTISGLPAEVLAP